MPSLRIDSEVSLDELSLSQLDELARLNETGMGNPRVQFVTRGLRLARPARRMGKEQQHIKMWVTNGTTTTEVVWWNAGNAVEPAGRFDLAFIPQKNE